MTLETNPGEIPKDELCLVRTFAAPVELVFEIWSKPEHVKRWLGPKDYTCTAFEMDFRPGGAWRGCIESKDHKKSWMSGVYREIEPNRRIVYTFAWDDGRDQPGVETVVTVTFSEHAGMTTQTFHQGPFVHEQGRDEHADGWSQVFDKVEAYVEGLKQGEKR